MYWVNVKKENLILFNRRMNIEENENIHSIYDIDGNKLIPFETWCEDYVKWKENN